MYYAFGYAQAFNQPIGDWEPVEGANTDYLFESATAFYQCIPWHDPNSHACNTFKVCGSAAAKQSNYLGTISQSINGRTCEQWGDKWTPENYPGKGLGDHNYCRNPDDTPGGAWCYTSGGPDRWEYCDVPTCDNCGSGSLQSDYRGADSVTKTGHTCQQWGPPHNSWTPENYPGEGLGDHNYCRNPDDTSGGAWCYTTDGPRWEYCDVPDCDSTCGTSAAKQSDYRGTESVTRNGHTCQQWGPPHNSWTPENYPGKGLGDHGLRGHNYCRNPDDMPGGAYCYTTDGPRWEYCDVPECDSTCGTSAAKQSDYRGTKSVTKTGHTCRQWGPPHNSWTPKNYPGKGLGDHNYCRNPDDMPGGAYCYTTDGPRWEYCDVRTCRDGEAASKTSGTGSTPLIVLFCVLGAILLLGVVYFVRKRRAAVAQPDEVPQLCTEPDPSAAA